MIQDIQSPFMAIAITIAIIFGIIAEIALVIALIYGMVSIIKGILIKRSQKGVFFLNEDQ
jgi:hypothetical protein